MHYDVEKNYSGYYCWQYKAIRTKCGTVFKYKIEFPNKPRLSFQIFESFTFIPILFKSHSMSEIVIGHKLYILRDINDMVFHLWQRLHIWTQRSSLFKSLLEQNVLKIHNVFYKVSSVCAVSHCLWLDKNCTALHCSCTALHVIVSNRKYAPLQNPIIIHAYLKYPQATFVVHYLPSIGYLDRHSLSLLCGEPFDHK